MARADDPPEMLGEDKDRVWAPGGPAGRVAGGRIAGGRERIGGGEDPAVDADQGAERGRGAGGCEERVSRWLHFFFVLGGPEGNEVLEVPRVGASGRVRRGEDV